MRNGLEQVLHSNAVEDHEEEAEEVVGVQESTKATPHKRLAENDLRRVLDTKRCRVSVTSTITSPPPVASSSSSDEIQSLSYDSPASPPPCEFQFNPATHPRHRRMKRRKGRRRSSS